MRVFRIALWKCGATARDALGGQSGFLTDGRWHTHGRYLDYAAESWSLATLERLVHYKRFDCLAPHVITQRRYQQRRSRQCSLFRQGGMATTRSEQRRLSETPGTTKGGALHYRCAALSRRESTISC